MKRTKEQTQSLIQQFGEEWCVLKPDGTKGECFSGPDAREKAEEAARKMDLGEAAVMTSPGGEDGHTHQVEELDEQGNGVTTAGGADGHVHEIVGGEVKAVEEGGHSHELVQAEEAPSEEAPAEEAKQKESVMPYSGKKVSGVSRFIEAGPKDAQGKVWTVVMLEAGMSKNGRLYTNELIEDVADRKIFEGVPAFGFVYRGPDGLVLDHGADNIDTTQFPKDVAGFHKNVRVEEMNGKKCLISDFHFCDDVLQKKAKEAFDAGNPNLFGFSIDAIGEADALTRETVEIKYIVRANSDDLVSAPAAGGRFVRMVASAMKVKRVMEGDKMTREVLLKIISEVKPGLLEGKNADQLSLEDLKKIIEGDAELAQAFKAFGTFSDTMGDETPEQSAPAQTAPASQDAAVATLVGEALKRELAPIKKAEHDRMVESACDKAGLEGEARNYVKELAQKSQNDAAHIDACVNKAQKFLESAGWTSPKLGNAKVGDGKEEKWVKAFEGAMHGRPKDGVPPFRSLSHMSRIVAGYDPDPTDILPIANACMGSLVSRWQDFRKTGSKDGGKITEAFNRRMHEQVRTRFREAINLAQLPTIFGDEMTRQMIADYNLPALNDWRAIVSKIGFVDDTRVQRRERMGQYPDLATVAEGDPYVQIVSPTDQRVSLTVAKHGNFEEITEEALLRNDLGWFSEVSRRLMRAANQDIRKTVWDLLLSNSALTFDDDVTDLFTAGHANQDANALSYDNLSTGRQRMREQTAYNGAFHELGSANIPKFLVVPPELEATANQISASKFEPTSNLTQVANLHSGIQMIVLDHATDANDWFLIADPSNVPTIEVDFVGSSDVPEMWVQDDPTVGQPFDSDEIRIKVRNWFGAAVLDYRSFYRGNPV